MEHIKTHYSSWEKSNFTLVTPEEPLQTEQKRAHYDWPAPTLPLLSIGFHGPPYSEEEIDKAALDLLAQIAFSQSSPLVQRLVVEEQKCQFLFPGFSDRRDPHLLTFTAMLRNESDLAYVEEQIFNELERLKNEPVSEEKLADVKSNQKYGFANVLGTSDGIAGALAFYINLTTDPGTVNKLFHLYDKITPQDIQETAKRYFRTTNSTVVTLTGGTTR
jgi:zinc protease